MKALGTEWYFYQHPSAFLGRICFDSRTIPMLEMGLVRGFRFQKKENRGERHWLWVDCISGGLPVTYQISDDEVGYLDLGEGRELELDQIIEILDESWEYLEDARQILGSEAMEFEAAECLYNLLIEDLPGILVKNGHSGTWELGYVLSMHRLRHSLAYKL